ncbi:unnamed protein product [Allacma fusca]|uniref:Uncharacterized protein n=1 Tax=Allacma fusca TaxID=39272 RepID=A0A8J2KKE4_9HEXA|nr:unnamed protein product [Allacma fusca]
MTNVDMSFTRIDRSRLAVTTWTLVLAFVLSLELVGCQYSGQGSGSGSGGIVANFPNYPYVSSHSNSYHNTNSDHLADHANVVSGSVGAALGTHLVTAPQGGFCTG